MDKRLDQQSAESRLAVFQMLNTILGDRWLKDEYAKDLAKRSLIAGWLSKPENEMPLYQKYLHALDQILAHVTYSKIISVQTKKKIETKVKTHGMRYETMGTITELSVVCFLLANQIPFEIGQKLVPNKNKDVDITAKFQNLPLHIECQFLKSSEVSDTKGQLLAEALQRRKEASENGDYEAFPLPLGAGIAYGREKLRIKEKVEAKIDKFEGRDLTQGPAIVMLDTTSTSPPYGGKSYSLIFETMSEVFTGLDSKGNTSQYANEPLDTRIRGNLDAIMWFEWNNELQASERGIYINPNSPYAQEQRMSEFAQIWNAE